MPKRPSRRTDVASCYYRIPASDDGDCDGDVADVEVAQNTTYCSAPLSPFTMAAACSARSFILHRIPLSSSALGPANDSDTVQSPRGIRRTDPGDDMRCNCGLLLLLLEWAAKSCIFCRKTVNSVNLFGAVLLLLLLLPLGGLLLLLAPFKGEPVVKSSDTKLLVLLLLLLLGGGSGGCNNDDLSDDGGGCCRCGCRPVEEDTVCVAMLISALPCEEAAMEAVGVTTVRGKHGGKPSSSRRTP